MRYAFFFGNPSSSDLCASFRIQLATVFDIDVVNGAAQCNRDGKCNSGEASARAELKAMFECLKIVTF